MPQRCCTIIHKLTGCWTMRSHLPDRPVNERLLAQISFRKGYLAIGEHDFAAAEPELRQALDYAVRHHDTYLEMNATGNMGYLLLHSYRFDQAIPLFNETLAAARKLGAGVSEARATGNLGWCYFRLGDIDKALQHFEEAETAFARMGNRYERQIWLGSIGDIHANRGEYDLAASSYRAALAIARDLGDLSYTATVLTNLADVYIEKGDLVSAERYNTEAIAIKHKLKDEAAEIYCTRNEAYIAVARNEFARAEQMLQTILRSPTQDFSLRLDAHGALARLYMQNANPAAAEAEFRSAIAGIEQHRSELVKDDDKLTYFSSLIRFYQEFVDFLMQKGRSADAVALAESSHAQIMSERLRLGRSQAARSRPAQDFQRIAAASRSTLLSYWLGPQKSYLWVITPKRIDSFTLPPAAEIRALINSYDQSIQASKDPLAEENAAGRKLYEALIAPAQALIAKTKRVILIPDSSLYSLNFETLPVPGANPHYLIQDIAVSIAPSLGLLVAGETRANTKSRTMLLIGDPAPSDAEYPKLRFAQQEMEAVEQSLQSNRPIVFFRNTDARPAAYLATHPEQFGLIHFVAHATANRDEPLESAIILSPGGSSYRLSARDIVKTPINAQLVTISACRGAGARIYAGEGLVGLAWAFLRAGSRNVIAGLWDVDDRSTAGMMAGVYAGISRGLTAGDALRLAKLSLIRSGGAYRKPYYWGAFQLFTTSLQ